MNDINQDNPNLNEENGESSPFEGKKKLTDMQLRIIQAIVGIVSAAALVLSMFIPSDLIKKGVIEQGDLLNYLFVVVFLVIMFGRRQIENKYRLRLNLFSLTLIDGIVVGLMIYVIQMLNDPAIVMADIYKVLIIVGGFLAVLVLGVLLPYLRYRKRVAAGTLPPIRIPEKPKPTEEEIAAAEEVAGPSTLEQKIAAMLSEAEQPPPSDGDSDAANNDSDSTKSE
jgi:hypothetical protein